MSTIEIHRRIGEQEISSIVGLAQIIERHDGHKALDDHAWVDLVQGGRKGLTGFLAVSGSPKVTVGYAQVSGRHNSWAIELLVHPRERHPHSSVARELLNAAIGDISRQGGGHVHLWVAKPDAFFHEVATEVGFSQGRELLQMRRALPLPEGPPETGGNLRTFIPGKDEQRWLEVNNAAFSWHPEQGGWSLEELLSREAESWFDPAGFFLYELGDQLAAFCWTKIHDDTDGRIGEIYVIGTSPEFTGKGLGETLCRVALDYLYRRGTPTGMLYVDATNVAARALYDKLGFHIDHTDRAYTIDVV